MSRSGGSGMGSKYSLSLNEGTFMGRIATFFTIHITFRLFHVEQKINANEIGKVLHGIANKV